MKISQREIVSIGVCALVVAIVGVPTLREYRANGGGKSVEELAADRQALQAEAIRLSEENAGLQREVNALTWNMPSRDLPPILLRELHAAARRSGVMLGTFRPSRAQSVKAGAKLPITVRFQAPFSKAQGFLAQLQSSQPRISLERLQIAATDAASDTVSLEARLGAYSALPVEQTKTD